MPGSTLTKIDMDNPHRVVVLVAKEVVCILAIVVVVHVIFIAIVSILVVVKCIV